MRLYYFTESYPFGLGEQWKTNELQVFIHEFDEVIVVPFSYAGNYDHPVTLPAGVQLMGPLFKKEKFTKSDVVKLAGSKFFIAFMQEFFQKKVYLNKKHLIQWLLATLRINKIVKHPILSKIIEGGTSEDILYFFWGRGTADALPFLKLNPFKKVFVRFHGYDLYEARNFGYLPYRAKLLQAVHVIAPCSEAGYRHLAAKYPAYQSKMQVVRLGSAATDLSNRPSTDGILRIVSCAFLHPVKRIHLIIEALALCDFPIEFYHIGDGPLKDALEQEAETLGIRDKVRFVGRLATDKVLAFYQEHPLDVFLNVSESEGVPVSIMEAFSVGIPALATNVGGNGEIVVEGCGRLMEGELTPRALAGYLKWFYQLSAIEKHAMRKTVKEKFEACWNAKKLTHALANTLKY